LLLEAFIQVGGDVTWLDKDSETLPDKLKNIIDFSVQLAYKPWPLIQESENHFVKFQILKSIIISTQECSS